MASADTKTPKPALNKALLNEIDQMSDQHTCAVHDVLMGGLQDQITSIEKGQNDLRDDIKVAFEGTKDFILNAHTESLKHIQVSTEKNREDITSVQCKLDKTIDKFQDRDREYLHAIENLKIKHAVITSLGISAAALLSFFINMSKVAEIIVQ